MALIKNRLLTGTVRVISSFGVILSLSVGLSLRCSPAEAQHPAENPSDSSIHPAAYFELDPAVSNALAAYDTKQDLNLLREAGDQTRLHDGEDEPNPAKATAEGRVRLANWMAILSRFRKDDDTHIDLQKPPLLSVTSPGPDGQQYPAGIDPADVKDPALRQRYEEAIEQNRVYAAQYNQAMQRQKIHDDLRTASIQSLLDARHKLGLSTSIIISAVKQADITPRDRNALISSLSQK